MERAPGSSESSKKIQSTVFYLPEYRELCVGLLASYDAAKLSRLVVFYFTKEKVRRFD